MNTILTSLEAAGREKVMLRLLCIVKHIDARGCWNTSNRYATFRVGLYYTKAHRASLWASSGVFPEEVIHTCDNPKCVNPAHLQPGTHDENMKDSKRKGRSPRGASQPHALHIPRHVTLSLIADRREGGTWKSIAEKYGYSRATCQRIVSGNHWCSP